MERPTANSDVKLRYQAVMGYREEGERTNISGRENSMWKDLWATVIWGAGRVKSNATSGVKKRAVGNKTRKGGGV